jgi:DNA-binding transcriptional MocR family regulator
MAQELERAGWVIDGPPDAGMFLWARHPEVENSLWTAEGARRAGLRLAPGAAFRPLHDASPWMRFAVACVGTLEDYRLLARAPELARQGERSASAREMAPADAD